MFAATPGICWITAQSRAAPWNVTPDGMCSVLELSQSPQGTSTSAALDSGAADVLVPCGLWLSSSTLHIPSGVTFHGAARDCAVIQQMPGVAANIRLLQPGPGQ